MKKNHPKMNQGKKEEKSRGTQGFSVKVIPHLWHEKNIPYYLSSASFVQSFLCLSL